MNKKIISMIALVLVLSMGMSVCALAARNDESLINTILDNAEPVINDLMRDYAELSYTHNDGTDRWNITIKIKDGEVTGIRVYEDIVDELINQLNGYPEDLKEISPNYPGAPYSIPLNGEEITTGQIVQFVLALGLKDGDNAFGPDSPISALIGHGFTAYITGVDDQVYEWVVRFTE